jgi:hypothetical protein
MNQEKEKPPTYWSLWKSQWSEKSFMVMAMFFIVITVFTPSKVAHTKVVYVTTTLLGILIEIFLFSLTLPLIRLLIFKSITVYSELAKKDLSFWEKYKLAWVLNKKLNILLTIILALSFFINAPPFIMVINLLWIFLLPAVQALL